ncbi:MAG: HAD-IA family hydrolase [Candidatus Dormibacteria bacterium]
MPGRWLTFDCFGTLVDWRQGFAATGELLFPGRGGDIRDAYLRHELDIEREAPPPRYREVLAEGLRRAMTELSLPLREDDADALAVTLPYWPVFPDVAAALAACRDDGWRLALLTNCDRDLIALTRRRLPVPFEAAVTAEDVGAYKPDPAHFRHFRAVYAPERWIHVAQSHHHDIGPCSALGIPSIWINRLGEPHEPSLAGAVLPDLAGLPAAAGRLAAPAT